MIEETTVKLRNSLWNLTFYLGAHGISEGLKCEIFDILISKNHGSDHDASHTWKRRKLLFKGRHLHLVGNVNLLGTKIYMFETYITLREGLTTPVIQQSSLPFSNN